jgi:hypothetical protein
VLEAKLNRTTTVSWFCTKRADWRVVYLSFREMLTPGCLCDELLLFYNRSTGMCASKPNDLKLSLQCLESLLLYFYMRDFSMAVHWNRRVCVKLVWPDMSCAIRRAHMYQVSLRW